MAKLISAFRSLLAFSSRFGAGRFDESNQLIDASLMPIDLAAMPVEHAA